MTRLRFRAVRITTLNSPGYSAGGTQADVRLLSSTSESAVATSGGSVAVLGTMLEQPPTQSAGGGANSSVAVGGVLTLATPLEPGDVQNYSFLLGVEQVGSFAAILSLEADTVTVP